MNKVNSFIRYQYRYKISSIYIIFGMIVGFISLYNGIGIHEYIKKYINDINGNKYVYSAQVYMGSTNTFNVKKYLNDVNCIVRIDDINAYIDEKGMNAIITIIVSSNEKTNYSIVEGRLPNEEEMQNHEKVVAIGREKKDAVYYEDGIGYILIEGEKYRVTGIIGTNNSDAQDYLIVTYYDCLGEKILERFDPDACELVLESNYFDVEFDYQELSSNAAKDEIVTMISPISYDTVRLTSEERNSKYIYICLFGFSIVSCVMITNFWIYQRKRDIAILRVLGYSRKMIIKKQAGEMLFHMAVAFILSAIIQRLLNSFVDIVYEISIGGLVMIITIFILFSMLIVIRPALKVMDEPPVYGINGK